MVKETPDIDNAADNVENVDSKDNMVDVNGNGKLLNVEENKENLNKNDNETNNNEDNNLVCCVCGKNENVKRCSGCKVAHYCSKDCQNSHWEYHSVYCQAIVDLQHLERAKLYGTSTVRQPSGLTGRTKRRMVDLVGKKPKIQCWLDDQKNEMLWDSGSQVTLVDRLWLNMKYPGKEIQSVSQFMDGRFKDFKLSAANSTEIKYDGVVVMDFGLKQGKVAFEVPVLVSSEPIAEPILGYNVLQHYVLDATEDELADLKECVMSDRQEEFESLVSLIQENADDSDFLAEIKASGDVTIPAGHKK